MKSSRSEGLNRGLGVFIGLQKVFNLKSEHRPKALITKYGFSAQQPQVVRMARVLQERHKGVLEAQGMALQVVRKCSCRQGCR